MIRLFFVYISINIISGTSIGAINGAIAAGSKNDNPVKDLEEADSKLAPPLRMGVPRIISTGETGAPVLRMG